MDILKKYGIAGDGIRDDSAALQALLDSGEKDIYIPQGCYLISKTLRINTGTCLKASPNARFIMDSVTKKKRGDFLITNSDFKNGNRDITISGGVWDGNNQGEGNKKPDIFDKTGYSGTVMNFFNVKGLKLSDFVVANSVTYNIRMCAIEDFEIENISFLSDNPGNNQDGLHFGGRIKNGHVKNIRALSNGQTNDDMIALNADDSIERVENLDLYRDSIEDVTFEDIFAENCHTVIRLLSIDAPIRNIHIKNVYGGYRCYAVNADAARYCRTPLFRDEDRPLGVGKIENLTIENMTVYPTLDTEKPAVCIESLADGLKISDFKIIDRWGIGNAEYALQIRNVKNLENIIDGKEMFIEGKEKDLKVKEFKNLEIHLRKQQTVLCRAFRGK